MGFKNRLHLVEYNANVKNSDGKILVCVVFLSMTCMSYLIISCQYFWLQTQDIIQISQTISFPLLCLFDLHSKPLSFFDLSHMFAKPSFIIYFSSSSPIGLLGIHFQSLFGFSNFPHRFANHS